MSVIEETKGRNNPYSLDDNGYFCALRFMKYKRPKPFDTAKDEIIFTAMLPLPNELRDNTSSEYTSPTSLGAVGDIINNESSSNIVGAAAMRNVEAITKIGTGAIKGLLNGLTFGAVGGATNLIDHKAIGTAFQQGMGMAPNPNQTIAFEGPSLRRHEFSWTLQPNSKEESLRIKKLIKKLKTLTLPSTAFSSGAALLNYPHMCRINFYPWDNGSGAENIYGWSDNSIIKIKKCFVSGVNVNYSPAGVPGFFEGTHEPFAITLNMSLLEIEYMLAEDFDPSVRGKEASFGSLIDRVKEGTEPIITGLGKASTELSQAIIEEFR